MKRPFRNIRILSLIYRFKVCQTLKEVIDASMELQYIIELGADEMVDCPDSPFTIAQRLEMLLDRRQAWARLDWKQRVSVDILGTCDAYELVAGVFAEAGSEFWDHRRTQHLAGVWLPSSFEPGHQIRHKNIGFLARNFAIDPSQDFIAFVVVDPVV